MSGLYPTFRRQGSNKEVIHIVETYDSLLTS